MDTTNHKGAPMTTGLDKATEEFHDTLTMLWERFPHMRPQLEVKAREVAEQMAAALQPLADFCAGRITFDEFKAIVEEHERAEQERARAHYGPGPVITVTCEDCCAVHEWDLEDHDGDYPPVYFECEDITGESCTDDDDGESGDDDGD